MSLSHNVHTYLKRQREQSRDKHSLYTTENKYKHFI